MPLQSFAQLLPTPPLPQNIIDLLEQEPACNLVVNEIVVTGNKKTKSYIIERELLIKQGDTIPVNKLFQLIDESRKLIYNTTLFTVVDITPVLLENHLLSIVVSVQEKWYIYPLPHIQLSDRNFNEWWNTYNADFSRLIYGMRFMHYNLSGRRDQLVLTLLGGYNRNFSVQYNAPYSNRALTEGFSVSASYTEGRETPVLTNPDNKLQLYKTDNFSQKAFSFGGTYLRRKGYYYRQQLGLLFHYNRVSDTVILLNPDYFKSNKNQVFYPDVTFKISYTNVDNVKYPLQGKTFNVGILKRGWGFNGGINNITFEGTGTAYRSIGKGWFTTATSGFILKAPFKQAFINRQAFGYKEFYLRGLEYYAIDAPVAALAQYTLKKRIADFRIKFPIKNGMIEYVPFQLFAKTFADAGWSYTHKAFENKLNNRFLYTGGFGLDILSLYDISLRIEYSFNQLGENGLFLHITGGF